MRNLKLQYCNRVDSKVKDIKFFLTDPSGGKRDAGTKLYFVTSEKVYATNEAFENVIEIFSLDTRQQGKEDTENEHYNFDAAIKKDNDNFDDGLSMDGNIVVENEKEVIVGADFLALNDEICIATSKGRVLSIAPETKTLHENSYCDVGLLSMAWSPEQEVVVFITKTQNVVVMTCTYDPICEHNLQDQCDHEQFVNVGWGRKETQFHGSEGKNAAKAKTSFEKSKDIDNELQDINTSWRHDGSYFAVSFLNSQNGRMFKVFDKEGTLQYISEKLNGLQPPISWRPSGTWIAVPHALPNKSTVGLFEKNGLRHREVVMPFNFTDERILNLAWSLDSDILAIHTEFTESLKQQIYFYTIGNYHWYLKQTISFNQNERVVVMQFGNDTKLERTLHIKLNTGQYFKYSWYFSVDKFEQYGIVGVIDGPKLLLTNLSKAIVPPPMCGSQIEINCNIQSCITLEDRERNELCLYDMEGNIHLYTSELHNPDEFRIINTFKPDNLLERSVYLFLANILLCPNNCLLATSSKNCTTDFLLMTFDKTNMTYSLMATLNFNGIVNSLHFDNIGKRIFTHILNGSIRLLEIQANRIIIGKEHVQLPNAATQIRSFTVNGTSSTVALCNNQSLYIDKQHLADYVTSLCLVGDSYLIFTKHTELYLMRLKNQNRTIDDIRNIESGGELIAVCRSSSRTVLQMPRGNLEAFCPRLLLLDRIGELLENHKYDLVMDLMIKQRINLNILCDHDINAFVTNVSLFVENVRNMHWLNLFLSDLKNEDFTKTMYAKSYKGLVKQHPYPPDFHIEEKIKYICEKILAYMENSENPMRFILPIITAKVKMGYIEEALRLIWKLKKQESGSEKSQSEGALKYLLYLVDVNELYNVALGTYDFRLVLFVAEKSQKDPREFLPFLNELKKLEINYCKFKIDEHLKRYEKALCNISKCTGTDRFEEALTFVIRHQLYREAMKYYEHLPDNYKRICLSYADFLRASGKLDNASLLYERGGDISQALRCSKHVLDWQRIVYLAHQELPNADDVAEVILSIVPALQEKQMHDEAYYLMKTYGHCFLDALDCLLNGNLYLKAIYEVRLRNENVQQLLDGTILPKLSSYVELLNINLADSQKIFMDYKRRLLELRTQQEQRRNEVGMNMNGWTADEVFDESDLVSDTTSMRSSHYTGSSRGTRKTLRSSKNRRKHERKHFSLKPGNPFEDIALIDALYGHVVKVFDQQAHIHDICKALLELKQDSVAAKLQKCYKKQLMLIQNALDEIWTSELAVGTQITPADSNIDYKLYQNEQRYALLDPLKRHKPQIKLKDWELEILR